MLEQLLLSLKDSLQRRDADYVQQFDDVLCRISALNDPACIGPLLSFLDDDSEFDETMFSIVHAIESFDDDTYVREILDNLPRLIARSPRWASIIHARIFNNPSTLAAYDQRIRTASDQQKIAVHDAVQAVRQRSLDFAPVCDALLAAL